VRAGEELVLGGGGALGVPSRSVRANLIRPSAYHWA
jgi:hypothetical protein